MGKPRKVKKTFQYSKNRRRAWKKLKKLPNIGCDEIKHAWDDRLSLQANLSEMGLSADPNKTLHIPSAKELLSSADNENKLEQVVGDKPPQKPYVIDDLETVANTEQPCRMWLAEPEVQYCVYMMERYGEDYKAMARDERNYYQDTPKQIRRKIATFRSIPEQYAAYLRSKSSAGQSTDS